MKSPSPGDADDDPVRMERLGGERGRNAVAHRARPRRELRPVLAELVEPVRPDGEVARAAGEDGVRGQAPAQEGHHLGEVEVAGKRPRLEVREVVGPRGAHPLLPRRRFDRKDPLERGRELGQVGHDRQVRVVRAAELLGIRVDVDERLRRPGKAEQRVATGRDVPETATDGDEQIRLFDPARECGVHADRQVACVRIRRVVDVVLAAKRGRHRNLARLAERDDRSTRLRCPAALADDDERSLGRRQPLGEPAEIVVRRRRTRRVDGRSVGGIRLLGEHVLGQRQHDGAGAAAARLRKRASDVLRHPVRALHLGRPLRHRPEHGRVVELLEGAAAEMRTRNLADEEDHRRRVLVCRVHGDGGVCRARPARDEADPRAARELPVRLGHVRRRRLVAARDEPDRRVVERVEDREIALPRHTERELDPVELELVDERLPARSHRSTGCSRKIVARWSFGFSSSAGSR